MIVMIVYVININYYLMTKNNIKCLDLLNKRLLRNKVLVNHYLQNQNVYL